MSKDEIDKEEIYFKNWIRSQKEFHYGYFRPYQVAFFSFLEGIKYAKTASQPSVEDGTYENY